MSTILNHLRYQSSHEWIEPKTESAAVGITDHAQAELTDIVFVDLPSVGREVTKGEALAVVESVKAASDIYAPVSGTIVAVNDALSGNPALVNTDPYTEGWLFQIALSNPAELEDLMDAAAYTQHLGE
jgi:glycine cleavage system H protein